MLRVRAVELYSSSSSSSHAQAATPNPVFRFVACVLSAHNLRVRVFLLPLMNFDQIFNIQCRRRAVLCSVFCVLCAVCAGGGAAEEVEKLELKTEVEGNLKKQSKSKPGKSDEHYHATPYHTYRAPRPSSYISFWYARTKYTHYREWLWSMDENTVRHPGDYSV